LIAWYAYLNPAEGMDIRLLYLQCVLSVCDELITRSEEASRVYA
jgi:hypothetical protein